MSVFQFKEFSVQQSKSAAKITTDATVFASSIEMPSAVERVLEVGTGTGVLSLMLAQRFPTVSIDALEINPIAFQEARANFQNSPWEDRLRIFMADFNDFNTAIPYDVIFSNPPFFQNNLQSFSNHAKNTAYHTNLLSFAGLAKGIDLNLSISGEAHVMLPSYEMSLFEVEMESLGFQCRRSLELSHQPNSKVIRLFNVFGRGKQMKSRNKIHVRDENNDFHPSYINLMKDFLIIF